MRLGDIRQITCHENDKALLFERFTDSQSVLCAFNLSHEPLDWSVEMLQNIPDQDSALNEDGISGRFSNGVLELPAFGFCFLKG